MIKPEKEILIARQRRIDQAVKDLNHFGYIAILWSIDDMKEMIEEHNPSHIPTDEQCMEILQIAEKNHDSDVGITWDLLKIRYRQWCNENGVAYK